MFAAASGVGSALVQAAGLSEEIEVSLAAIEEVEFYKRQLGLPQENSYEFAKMALDTQEKIRRFSSGSEVLIRNLTAAYGSSYKVDAARFIPLVGVTIAGSVSFSSTYSFLHGCLDAMEETALEILGTLNTKLVNDMPLD